MFHAESCAQWRAWLEANHAVDANTSARAAWATFLPSARKAMLWWVISAA